jgi:hypothetical protein
MKSKFCALVVFGLLMASNRSDALQITSTTPWTDTGIDVVAGQLLQITASGTVSYATGSLGVDANGVGPGWDGTLTHPGTVAPSAIWLSLIGKIGGTTDIGTGTLLESDEDGKGDGFVGESYSILVSMSGRLFLGFNDTTANFGDNSGSFSVNVTLSPAGVGVPDAQSTLGLLLMGLVVVGGLYLPRIRVSNRRTPTRF